MGAVRGREGVVAVDIAQGREVFRHLWVVLFFHRGEAGVLNQHDGAVGEGFHLVGVGHFDKGHGRSQSGLKRGQGHAERHLWHDFAFGTTKVREEDRNTASGNDVFDGGHDAVNAGCIGHNAVFDGDVDIHAHQNAFSIEVHIVECFPSHLRLRQILG